MITMPRPSQIPAPITIRDYLVGLGDDDLIEIRLAISAELARRRMARNPSADQAAEKAPPELCMICKGPLHPGEFCSGDLGQDCGTDRVPIR
jgi:hypothetical protein